MDAVKSEVKDSGVSFTLLLPGESDTNFWHRAGMDTTTLGLGPKAAPTKVAQEGYEAMRAGKDRMVAGKPDSKFIGKVINKLCPTPKQRVCTRKALGLVPASGMRMSD